MRVYSWNYRTECCIVVTLIANFAITHTGKVNMPQTMRKQGKKWWQYLIGWLGVKFEEKADPKVQLEQAVAEAQEQQQRLKEQAASVIAHQKQTEIRLNRAMDELEKVNANAQQAVLMADEAAKSGDQAKVSQYASSAEAFANRLIALEREVEDLKAMQLQSTQAANQAKAAVQTNASALQQKLAERQKLLSQLDQAKMQEQMNTAMTSLSETVGDDVPTLNEVRDKIEARYAKAKGMAELTESSVESRMLEVEQASMNFEAQARLAKIREQMGLPAASESDQAPSTPTDNADADNVTAIRKEAQG
jgi:phage shock protein A